MKDPSSWRVYVVTDRGLSRGRTTLEVVEAAVKGGASVIQLREKELPTRDFYEQGVEIRDFLRARGVPLIINDRIDVALALDADGAHVGQSDMPVTVARKLLGGDKILGLSVETPEQVNQEAMETADYLAVSPVFLTPTKDELKSAWGLDGVRRIRSMTDLPLVAIGSIKMENARQVIEAGADCVAVVSAIVSAEDPEQATRMLVAEVRAAKAARRA